MSRIGKLPVDIPAGVTITVGDKEIRNYRRWAKRHASGSCPGKYHDKSRG